MAVLNEKNKIITMAVLIGIAIYLTYYFHAVIGSGTVFTHYFYLPIILAALWWKRRGVLVAVFLSTLLILSHIYLRTDVVTENDFIRGISFIFIGLMFAIINERREKQGERLYESESRFRLAFEESGIGIALVAPDGKWLKVNQKLCEITGYTEPELLAIDFQTITHPDDLGADLEHVKQMLEGTIKTYTVEKRYIRKDNEIICVNPTVSLVRTHDGKPMYFIAQIENITERKQAEKLLKESERKFRSIVESANAAIILSDINGKIIFWNRGAEEVFQYSETEIIDKPLTTIMPERHKSAYLKAMEHFRKTGEGKNFGKITEIEGLKKDGTEVSVQLSFTKWKNGKGDVFSGILYDITDRKQSEEALRKSEEFLAETSRIAKNGGWEIDLETNTVSFTDETYRIHGLPQTKPPNVENAIKFYTPEAQPIIQGAVQEAIANGTSYDLELPFINAYGEHLWVRTTGKVEFKEGKAVRLYGYIQDITDRKHAEEEIVKYRDHLEEMVEERTAQLEAANKELEAFSYSVSHDLRAPLRSIDGFSQALIEDYPDKLDEQGKDYLNRVRSASEKMAQLIEAILSLSRLTRGEMKRSTVDLTDIVNSITSGLKLLHPDRKVEFVIAENVTANCDYAMLQIVLENLLRNACKFTGKHPSARIEFGVTEKDGKAVYFVKDDGAGFDMHYADKLFTAFQRLHTESEFKGIGIGLATVQRIIHRHGGEIWAEGEIEKGATFYFTLE